ncbi:MAG: DNA mismatch repair protein MutS, partial [Rhodobacteraceae bacterium]|nr:DNA mismatch repair protein MutS [Paracoccaceae bacterium]
GIVEEPPLRLGDGGAIAPGYDPELDTARALRDDTRQVIAQMQSQYQEDTGISALKVKHNNVLGYFVETPATHQKRMMSEQLNATFMHRQTTANAVRFTTVELAELEGKIARAADQTAELEKAAFEVLTRKALERSGPIARAAAALAAVDVAASLAELAETEHWARPELFEDRRFHVIEGRHPVVEAALRKELRRGGDSHEFVPNDCDLSADHTEANDRSNNGPKPIWLVTGPNMAGKSTFLRQNALIAILTQMGAYAPAARAEIGIVDQLFSRVGAADDLARGRSTFMVEMVETAAILNQAGPRALVILDEIGRGTATYDGLSIAWATLEHLHDVNQCRALFATHYHELTALTSALPGLKNATIAVKEWKGEVVFLRQVISGAADRSYGVQVARLAGLPKSVVGRANEVLKSLETGSESSAARARRLIEELPLFAAAAATDIEPEPAQTSGLEARLRDLDPDAMTPRDALEALYSLKALLEEE